MKILNSKQRVYAFLLILGAGILLFRTLRMISQDALNILVWWAGFLLIAEMLIDAGCIAASVRWWIRNDAEKATLPLRLGAAAALLHAFRVLIFVMGRIGPWINFDVRLEQRAMHGERWTWGWVYFAAIMSVLGVTGVIVIWQYRRRKFKARSQD